MKYALPIDVRVRFRGGVINEFYPEAFASVALDADRIRNKMERGVLTAWNGDVLNNYVVGSLQWQGLDCTTPWSRRSRKAACGSRRARCMPAVSTYRGRRGRELSLLSRGRASRRPVADPAQGRFLAPERTRRSLPGWNRLRSPSSQVWLADIRADGKIAFREQGPLTLSKAAPGREVVRAQRFRRR